MKNPLITLHNVLDIANEKIWNVFLLLGKSLSQHWEDVKSHLVIFLKAILVVNKYQAAMHPCF